jgi:FkbM family methyltransferase
MPQIVTVRGHTFLSDGLGPESVVVDLGANRGEFSSEVSQRFGSRCFAVEASPEIARVIPANERVRVFNYAITDADGPVHLNVAENPELTSIHASNVPDTQRLGSVVVPGYTLARFLDEHGLKQVDLLKVDIEGAEVQLFGPATSDSVLRSIRQITMEFHDFTGVMSAADVRAIVERLRAAGFYAIRFSHSNMDWLFLRADELRIGRLSRFWMRVVVRNWRFLKRNLPGGRRE